MPEDGKEQRVRVNRRDLFKNIAIAIAVPLAARGVEAVNRLGGNAIPQAPSWLTLFWWRLQALFQKPPPPLGPPGSGRGLGASVGPKSPYIATVYDAGGKALTQEEIESLQKRFSELAVKNRYRVLGSRPGVPPTICPDPRGFDERC